MSKTQRALAIISIGFIGLVGISPASPAEEMKSETLLIKGGTVHTITRGVIYDGQVLIKNGKIEKIGKSLPLPEGAAVIEARDGWIMPGFVVAHTYPLAMHGLIKEDKNPKIYNYLDPFSMELRLCLAAGVTTFSPNFGISLFGAADPTKKNYSFFNAILKSHYGSLRDMFVKEPVYLYIDMTALRPSEKDELRGFFQKSREYLTRELEYEKKKGEKDAKPPVLAPDIKNYVAVLKRELPVRFYADLKKDILKVLAFVDEFGFQAQILGAAEGWRLAEEIGRRNISTIIVPATYQKGDPYERPVGGSNIRNSVLQREKGIEFALLCSSPYAFLGGTIGDDLLTFPLAGAFAVRGGLAEKDALEALTIKPAKLLGIADRVGSLEEGKDADIIILDGNPLDYRTYVNCTIVNGCVLYDKSQSNLFKKIPKPKRMF
jgi:hypothetical protein